MDDWWVVRVDGWMVCLINISSPISHQISLAIEGFSRQARNLSTDSSAQNVYPPILAPKSGVMLKGISRYNEKIWRQGGLTLRCYIELPAGVSVHWVDGY